MNQPDFGRKLSEVRRANGLTQDELAEKCKITVRTIQRIFLDGVFQGQMQSGDTVIFKDGKIILEK